MKLLNQSITYISLSLLVIIGLWAVVFYVNMIDEIEESVDEGLDHYKRQIIFQAHQDTALLKQVNFNEGFFSIREIAKAEALATRDRYRDTLMHVPKRKGEMELEPFRLLTTAFEDDGRFYQLRVINSMVEQDDLISQIFRNTIGLYFFLIVSIIFINNLVLRRVWRPFYRFIGQLKKFRLGSRNRFPEVRTKTKEFLDLQTATHTLLKHNKAVYDQQKQFIGNASHELQTPLAIALNKLELLVEKGQLSNDQVEDIGETMHIIERLIRLNKSLLLLTKIENDQFLKNQEIIINQIVQKGIRELEEIATYKEIYISTKETTELSIEMDPALAEILIFNLLRNAIFHSKEKSHVSIKMTENQIEFGNSGEKPLQSNLIFNRFQKSGGSSGGSGLGLAIVKAICELYGFAVFYRFQDQQHHFFIRFKK